MAAASYRLVDNEDTMMDKFAAYSLIKNQVISTGNFQYNTQMHISVFVLEDL